MIKKIKVLLFLISFSVLMCLMSNTYSRYVASTTGDINASLSKWQILVNTFDITNNTDSSLAIVPVIEKSQYVLDDTVAPSSRGYFDIDIDPSNVDVSFKYTVNLNFDTGDIDIPDLIITDYVINPDETLASGGTLTLIPLTDGLLTETFYFENDTPAFRFESFTIRIYFEWIDGVNEVMDDESDAMIGFLASNEDLSFSIKANVTFEQVINRGV